MAVAIRCMLPRALWRHPAAAVVSLREPMQLLFSSTRKSLFVSPFSTDGEDGDDALNYESDLEPDVSNDADSDNHFTKRQIWAPSVYKAILIGTVGRPPFQRKLNNGREVTCFSVVTGGILSFTGPLKGESPEKFARRSTFQSHRVCVFPPKLQTAVVEKIKKGLQVYVEGNMETRVFDDTLTGAIKRIREVVIRQNGRFVIMGQEAEQTEIKEVDPNEDAKIENTG